MSDRDTALLWQPWAPDDLAGEKPQETAPALSETACRQVEDSEAEVQQQLLALRARAEQEGQRQGFDTGRQQGYDVGYQAGAEAGHQRGLLEAQQQQQPLTEHWQAMVLEFQQTLDALDSVIASRLMQIALSAARQVLGQAPLCDGTALLGQIQQMLQQEPIVSGKPQLRVHPADLELVEQRLGATLSLHGWRLLADSQLHRGGCRVNAEEGDLDASLATRWHELCRLTAPGEI